MAMANNLRSVFQQPQSLLLLLLLFHLLLGGLLLLEAADPLYHFCGSTGNFTVNSPYEENLGSLMRSISSDNSVTYGFYNLSSGQAPDQVNGIALCRGDVALSDCWACIKNSSLEIVRQCPVQKEAIIYYGNCLLRYSNQSIFRVVETGYKFYMWNNNNQTDVASFSVVLGELMYRLRIRAASGSSTQKFAAGNETGPDFRTLYGLAQCTPDLSEPQCNDCLVSAREGILKGSKGKIGGRLVGPSCNMRFEVYRFYDPSAEAQAASPVSPPNPTTNITAPPPEDRLKKKKGSPRRRIVITTISTIGILALLLSLALIIMKRMKGRRRPFAIPYVAYFDDEESSSMQDLEEDSRQSDLPFFSLSTISAATDNFSFINKLGQGGFGSVYKGVLENGREIAVKRLSKSSGQGMEEFKNEVKLIAKLQHRNLVKMLGYCIQGEEKMLIYECLPNKSLDSFLFDEEKKTMLDWRKRFEIACGVARGILYLHRDSRLRIIHRDLKASNVLLDASMNPKISDFGMARICGEDQIEGNTRRVVGTYGYMSPEYAMEGLFSIKSDVYSFGVLLLEIISGKRNSSFYKENSSSNLISHVWELWKEGSSLDIVDPSLDGTYAEQEVLRCIQIGLLCVQEFATDRPTMSAVVFMLENTTALPSPRQPPSAFMRKPGTANASSSSERNNSVNNMSLTAVEPR